jgi:hypothetical protein
MIRVSRGSLRNVADVDQEVSLVGERQRVVLAGSAATYSPPISLFFGLIATKVEGGFGRRLGLAAWSRPFDRIVTDWGRLKALGAPLEARQVSWDGNSGVGFSFI